MSEETLETLRRGYEAFSRGDMSAATGLATSDVEWGASGVFAGIDGLYRGPEVIQEWSDVIGSDWVDCTTGTICARGRRAASRP
jgi:ketosteroid isomerase-like protein